MSDRVENVRECMHCEGDMVLTNDGKGWICLWCGMIIRPKLADVLKQQLVGEV